MNKWKEHWHGPLIALLNSHKLSLKTAVDMFGISNLDTLDTLIQELRDAGYLIDKKTPNGCTVYYMPQAEIEKHSTMLDVTTEIENHFSGLHSLNNAVQDSLNTIRRDYSNNDGNDPLSNHIRDVESLCFNVIHEKIGLAEKAVKELEAIIYPPTKELSAEA